MVKRTKSVGYRPAKKKCLSRNQACKQLGLDLTTFRKLCILKGVYPYDNQKGKGNHTYYKVKDIKLMAQDPLIAKFAEFQTWLKRLRKAVDKKDEKDQERQLKWTKPEITYDHLVKERYASFGQALADLDDCLSLLFMFRNMPAGYGIEPDTIKEVKQLTDEFLTYVVLNRGLKKTFVSVKGIYYQVEIESTPITWVTPFNFPFDVAKDQDEIPFFIFKDFLTFYLTLLKFINCKLFISKGVSYPLKDVVKTDSRSYTLDIGTINVDIDMAKQQEVVEDEEYIEKAQESIKKMGSFKPKEADEKMAESELAQYKEEQQVDQFDDNSNADAVMAQRFKNLFKGMVVYISRECPLNSLQFIVQAFGGDVVYSKNASNITHYVVDRPNFKFDPTKHQYVQPQWIYDSVNARLRLPVDQYLPGEELPPHLSPFVEYQEGEYVPEYAETIRKLYRQEINAIKGIFGTDGEKTVDPQQQFEDLVEEEDDVGHAETRYAAELEAERLGKSYSDYMEDEQNKDGQKKKKSSRSRKKEYETRELRKSMLDRKGAREYRLATERVKREKKKQDKIIKRRRELDAQKPKKRKSVAKPVAVPIEEPAAAEQPKKPSMKDLALAPAGDGEALDIDMSDDEQPTKKPSRKRKPKQDGGRPKKRRKHKH